jgi:hypothetical protein
MKVIDKKYYSNELQFVIEQIAFDEDNVNVMGTAGRKGFLYPADIDLYEIITRTTIAKIISVYKKIIKRIINNPNLNISDIKCGEVPEWKVIDERARIDKNNKLRNYDYKKITLKLISLKKQKVITDTEYNASLNILKQNPNRIELETIKKDIRFHILRWKPNQILNGFQIYRNQKFTFEYALKSSGLFKMDVISYIVSQARFIEFSIIYDIRIDNIKQNLKPINPIENLQNDILYYNQKKDYFKMLKRYFSLINYKIKYKNDKSKRLNILYGKIFDILNGDLGILYQVTQDIETIIIILENDMKYNTIDYVLDGFIDRLSNIYSLNVFLKNENDIMRELNMNIKNPSIDSLKSLNEKIYNILNVETNKKISRYNISI